MPSAGTIGGDTLNSLYFGIGVSIILALLVALVGPLLVDWTAYRAAFEEQASQVLGHPVRVTGTADATLLPVPELAFTGVVIGEDPSDPLMTVGRFQVEVELFPLLSGEVRVTRMLLEDPRLTLRVSDSGEVDWIAEGGGVRLDPQKIVFDRVDVTGGTVRIEDQRRALPVEITGVNAAIEARSLIGPYKFDGAMVVEGEPVMMRLSTGARDSAGRVVVKATLTPATRPLEIALDGAVAVDGHTPGFDGSLRVRRIVAEGETALPWTLTSDIEADTSRARANKLEFRYGPEDRPFSIDGAATVDISGEPTFDAVLSARQIDLDRTLGAGPGEPVSFERALDAIATTLGSVPLPPIPGRLGFDIPGIVVGGSLVQQVRLDVSTADDGWSVETLSAGLPGRSSLGATGHLQTRPALSFQGTASLASEQPATMLGWWYPNRERTTLDAFDIHAGVSASDAGLKLTDVDARLGPSNLRGEIGFIPERSGRKAALDVSLSADKVALAQLTALSSLATGQGSTGGTDVTLRLSADAVTGGETEAQGVDVNASLVAGTLTVERFTVADLAGARVTAEGAVRDIVSAPDGSLQGRISAERLDGLADLVESVAPGSATAEMLRTAAPVLVPASLEATVTAAKVGDGTNATLKLSGSAGGSDVDTAVSFAGRVDRWHDAAVDMSVDMSGPSGVRLMRQLGFPVPDIDVEGVGRLRATAHGVPQDGLDVSLDGALGGTSVTVKGEVRLPALTERTASLSVGLRSDDVVPILALGGDQLSSFLDRMPADLTADARLDGSKLTISNLTGTVDERDMSGSLMLDTSPAVPAVRGELSFASIDLQGLLEMALGPNTLAMPFVESRNPWPELPFGPTFLDTMDVDVALAIDRVSGFEDIPGLDGFKASLRSSAAGIGFDGISAGFAGGKLQGSLVVKRDLEGQAAVSGTLALDGVDAASLAWRRNDRSVVTGSLGADIEFNAAGRTVAGLVSTLAGGGTLRLEDGVIRSMNPQAFSAVIRAADGGQALPDERIRDLFTDNVDVGDLRFDRIDGAFTIAAGVLRAPSLVVTGADAQTSGSAVVDLGRRELESDWTLSLASADVSGAATAPPQVDVLFRGRIAAPERKIDVTAFSSYLGIRAFEKETERVLVLQADILERELLSRQVIRVRESVDRRLRAEEDARRRAEAEEEARRAARDAATSGEILPPDNGAAGDDRSQNAAPDQDDFVDVIGRRLDELLPEDTQGASPGASGGSGAGPLILTPPSDIERIPLPPPQTGDASLPGVDIPPPPL